MLDNIEAQAQPDPVDPRETIPGTGGLWTAVDTMASTEEDHEIHWHRGVDLPRLDNSRILYGQALEHLPWRMRSTIESDPAAIRERERSLQSLPGTCIAKMPC